MNDDDILSILGRLKYEIVWMPLPPNRRERSRICRDGEGGGAAAVEAWWGGESSGRAVVFLSQGNLNVLLLHSAYMLIGILSTRLYVNILYCWIQVWITAKLTKKSWETGSCFGEKPYYEKRGNAELRGKNGLDPQRVREREREGRKLDRASLWQFSRRLLVFFIIFVL